MQAILWRYLQLSAAAMFSGDVDVMLSGLYCKQTCAKTARKFDAVTQGVGFAWVK